MPKHQCHAAIQTETVQLTETTTQTKAAMNLLACWSGKCSECSLPNPTLKRSASSPPDFGQWRMRESDSVPGSITYPERFESCRGIVIDDHLKMNTHIEGGLENKQQKKHKQFLKVVCKAGCSSSTHCSSTCRSRQSLQQQHALQQQAAAAHAAAAADQLIFVKDHLVGVMPKGAFAELRARRRAGTCKMQGSLFCQCGFN